jgi:hypothetical protein
MYLKKNIKLTLKKNNFLKDEYSKTQKKKKSSRSVMKICRRKDIKELATENEIKKIA